jgi:hypothetical protein
MDVVPILPETNANTKTQEEIYLISVELSCLHALLPLQSFRKFLLHTFVAVQISAKENNSKNAGSCSKHGSSRKSQQEPASNMTSQNTSHHLYLAELTRQCLASNLLFSSS